MLTCKLCGAVMIEGMPSKADEKMCRKCYSDVVKYKRWQTQKKKLDVFQESKIFQLHEMFERNLQEGKYVPRCYMLPKHDVTCKTCGDVFKTNTKLTLCNECRSRETGYLRLHQLNQNSDKLVLYDLYYDGKFKEGKHVPQLYLLRRHK